VKRAPLAVIVAGALALALALAGATSACKEGVRQYPRFRGRPDLDSTKESWLGASIPNCGRLEAFFTKTGKEGVGITLRFIGEAPQPCLVEVASVELRLGDEVHRAARLPAPMNLGPGQTVHVYVPILFDGERTWNEGKREGMLVVTTRPALYGDARWAVDEVFPERFLCEER
jgi:hypothetical protein